MAYNAEIIERLLPGHCLEIGEHHRFIVTERNGDIAHKLMCQQCLKIINYKDVKREQGIKPVAGNVIDMESYD